MPPSKVRGNNATVEVKGDSLSIEGVKGAIKYSNDEVLQNRIETACDGLLPNIKMMMLELSEENKKIVTDYILDSITQNNIAVGTKRAHLINMVYLVRHWKGMSLRKMKADHVDTYLQRIRRSKDVDPDEKWISTHNHRAMSYLKFFKWLYFPNVDPEQRKKPAVVSNIVFYKRKAKTNIRPEDLWTKEEDRVFLKYCPDPRISLYHTMSDDTSGRPHELVVKRIGEVKIYNHNGTVYAEVEIGRGGKTRPRIVPLIVSLPYFKALLRVHPQGSNPNAFIFYPMDNKSKYANRHIKAVSIYFIYKDLKEKFFPKLLESPDTPQEDKAVIQSMLQKPWNPYIRRHTALTDKAKRVNEYNLRQHAGWTKTSSMVNVYIHDLGGESSKELLTAYGIIPRDDAGRDLLQPKYCTNCNEPNKPDARVCANPKCNLPLTFDAYFEMKERESESKDTIQKLLEGQKVLQDQVEYLMGKKNKKIVSDTPAK